ncbi:MAG: DUF5681 domain-containing protein [Pseudomonadota bacterium]
MAKDKGDQAYTVGYGKPPKSTRFRPGQSGNPRGRPKGARGVGKVLEEALSQEVSVTEGGRTSRITKREALILSLVTKALKGDMRAASETLKLIAAYEEQPKPQAGPGVTINVIDTFDDPQ